MPRGKARQDTDMLTMALVGYEQQKSKIDEKIREIKGLLGGERKSAASANGAAPEPAAAAGPRRRRVLSAEPRRNAGGRNTAKIFPSRSSSATGMSQWET